MDLKEKEIRYAWETQERLYSVCGFCEEPRRMHDIYLGQDGRATSFYNPGTQTLTLPV